MRSTRQLRDQLERAAIESGRSLTQEVEYRLERSFDREAVVVEALGGENAKLVRELLKILGGPQSKDQCIKDSHFLAAITVILDYADGFVDEIAENAISDLWMNLSVRGIRGTEEKPDKLSEAKALERALKFYPQVERNPNMREHLQSISG